MPAPVWLAPALKGAGAALGLGALFGRGKKARMETIETIPTLNPEQQAVMSRLAPFLRERIGQGLPTWTGEFVAPPTEYEETGLARLGEYLQTGIPELTQYGLSQYQQALGGLSPQQVYDWYMQYVSPLEQRYMEQTVIPGIREARVAPGTLYGTPYETATGRAWEQFGAEQLGRIGTTIQAERERAAGLLPYLPAMTALEEEAPLRRVEAGMQYGALPRMLEQADLEARLQEFIRTSPELSPVLNQALQLLGTTTQAAYQTPYQPSPFAQLLGAVAPGIGTYLGGLARRPTMPISKFQLLRELAPYTRQ